MTEKKKRLTLEDLAKLPDVPQEEVYIPQWDRTILVQGISKATQIKLGRLINADETDAFDYQKELLKVSVVEPPLDDDAINMIYEKDSTIVDQILVALNDINASGGSGDLADNFEDNSDLAFEFRLARDLGFTVGELRQRISVVEYQQWIGFYLYEKKRRDYQQATELQTPPPKKL